MTEISTQPTEATFSDLVTAAEERADGLYSDLSALELFAQHRAQSNGDRTVASVAETLKIARSFIYQTFRMLRQLSGSLIGLGISRQAVDPVATTPACCPAWSLSIGAWEWMTPPSEPEMLVQPSVKDMDGMLLPILHCPFCGAKAPSRIEAEELRPPAVDEDDEVTAEVKVPEA